MYLDVEQCSCYFASSVVTICHPTGVDRCACAGDVWTLPIGPHTRSDENAVFLVSLATVVAPNVTSSFPIPTLTKKNKGECCACFSIVARESRGGGRRWEFFSRVAFLAYSINIYFEKIANSRFFSFNIAAEIRCQYQKPLSILIAWLY